MNNNRLTINRVILHPDQNSVSVFVDHHYPYFLEVELSNIAFNKFI